MVCGNYLHSGLSCLFLDDMLTTRTKRYFLIFLLTLVFFQVSAQNEQPKVGLVLSGGGARGMAHIGVLQVLEEIGIYPDYITGTSMGSVVGGLYSLGYTAEELDSITKTADWGVILSNDLDYRRVAYEEKQYFGRYLLELPMNGFTPSLPKGVIDGQNLQKLFSDLTRSAHDVKDFDDLPIPFRAVATDIATGESVTLKSGSLTNSIRASMAIPSIFTPVEIDEKLLVDGGLVRNFPVTEVREMGADIIIGVFVSTDLDDKEDLNSLVDILFQSSFVLSAYDSREQSKLVDFYVEPDLEGYSSSSFDASDSIISRGYQTASLFKDTLKDLYDSLISVGKEFHKPVKIPTPNTYQLRNIHVNGIEDVSEEFILGRLPIKEGVGTTLEEIDLAVDKIFGTRYFSKVGYDLNQAEDGSGRYDLTFSVEEKANRQLKFAVHYNNEARAGINLNYTSRNNVFPNSRFIAEVDLAENFRTDISYLKYLGKRQLTAITAGYSHLNSELPLFNDEGQETSRFGNDRNDFFGKFQTTYRPDQSIGVQWHYNISVLKPKVTDLDFLKRAKITTSTVAAFWELITFDRPFIPTEGVDIKIEGGYTLQNDSEQEYQNITEDEEDFWRQEFRLEEFYFARFSSSALLPINNKLSAMLGLNMIYSSDDRTGINHQVGIGGFYQNYTFTTPFWGAKFYQYSSDNFLKASLGLQWEAVNNIYITLKGNYLDSRYPLKWIDPDRTADVFAFKETTDASGQPQIDLIRNIYGVGLGVAFNSILGPLQFNIGTTNLTDQYQLGLNIGYWY